MWEYNRLTSDGDYVACASIEAALMKAVKTAIPSVVITMAPVLRDVYPYATDITQYNFQAPLVAMAIDVIDTIWVRSCACMQYR
jgi:hypothetical protein